MSTDDPDGPRRYLSFSQAEMRAKAIAEQERSPATREMAEMLAEIFDWMQRVNGRVDDLQHLDYRLARQQKELDRREGDLKKRERKLARDSKAKKAPKPDP